MRIQRPSLCGILQLVGMHRMAPVKRLTAADHDAPKEYADEGEIKAWAMSKHASAGVNCSSCHIPEGETQWIEMPDHTSCNSCHGGEVQGWLEGKTWDARSGRFIADDACAGSVAYERSARSRCLVV